MRKPKNSKVVPKEVIVIDSDTNTDTDDDVAGGDREDHRAKSKLSVYPTDDWGLDSDYEKYLVRFSENFRRKKGRLVKTEKNRERRKTKSPSKKLKIEDGIDDHKLIRMGRRSKSPSNGFSDHNTIRRNVFKTKDIRRKKRDAKLQKILRALKRLKIENESSDSIPMLSKGEAPRGKKIDMNKIKDESKSISHVKEDNIVHSFKARKKAKEERLLTSIDKSYANYLAYLRNSVTIFKPDQLVKDSTCLSDSDIIAVSDHPFSDGDIVPFETDKDDKVLDLEDGIGHDDLFNSLFSNKLMEILRKPYDENECLKLCYEVKLKRPVTRSRQLRDGREIEYNVDNQFAQSYLEQYTDFKKKFRRHRKDKHRALNLLRGFFFYFENIVLEGAFKPWAYEQHLESICFDARGCKEIEYLK